MRHWLKILVGKSDLFKNLITLVTGTALAQIVPILLQPLLRRVYSPEEFGVFAIYLSIISVFAVVISGKYEMAVILPDKDSDSNQLVGLSLFIGIVISFCLFAIAIIFKNELALLLNIPVDENYIFLLLPIGIFLMGFYQVLNFWLVRKKKFRKSSINKISRRSSEGLYQMSSGLLGSGSSGLVIGALVGNFFNVVVGLRQVMSESLSFTILTKKDIMRVAKKYKEFPIYNMIPALLNSLSLLMPVFIINEFYTSNDVGQFDLSRQMLAIPLSLISVSLSQVLFQHVSESKNKLKTIKPIIYRILKILVSLSIIAFLIIHFAGVELFSLVFGDEWEKAGQLTRILIISYAVKFVVSPMSIILTVFEKLKTIALWQLFYFSLMISLWYSNNIDIFEFISMVAAIDVVAYFVYLLLILKSVIKYEKSI